MNFWRRFRERKKKNEPGVDAWANLTALQDQLRQAPSLKPLTETIDELSGALELFERASIVRRETDALRTQLEGLLKDLMRYSSQGTPPAMTTSMLELCRSIQDEVEMIHRKSDRSTTARFMYAEQDKEEIAECYRRIKGHLERIMLDASLDVWNTVNKQATEAQLRRLNPSMSARYDSAEAHVLQRRECTTNTRKWALLHLEAWSHDMDGEKVCWINGMAGTGKTTVTNTLCAALDQRYELGASFFCSRLLPACRDVKLIIPTIAYQLARFSNPFKDALLKALDLDPDAPTKALRVQFECMILKPLQSVTASLPSNIAIVIDALDECDDGNGVEQILEAILKHAPDLPVKFLISSRPEPRIQERIHPSAIKTQLVLHEIDPEVVMADIEAYLQEELASIPTPPTVDQLAALVERMDLLFSHAATVVRYIKSGNPLERLAAVLKVLGPGEELSNGRQWLREQALINHADNENNAMGSERTTDTVGNVDFRQETLPATVTGTRSILEPSQSMNDLSTHAREVSSPTSPKASLNFSSPSLGASAESPAIGRMMETSEIVACLGDHGCQDVTALLDMSTASTWPISRGGFGDIYTVRLHDSTEVAVKTTRMYVNSSTEGTRHLKHAARELHTWAKCNHPHVLKLLGLAIFRGQIGMVSPWMKNGNLSAYLSKTPDANRCMISAQVSEGLAYLHANGIVHGDLKGMNILVSDEGAPVLTDFGNAVLSKQSLPFTTTTTKYSVSLRWTAPELLDSEQKSICSREADIYALGMTILEIMTGQAPYSEMSEKRVMLCVCQGKLPDRPQVIAAGDPQMEIVWSLLLSCWLNNPEERPTAAYMSETMKHGLLGV